jgi:hypothetical protein
MSLKPRCGVAEAMKFQALGDGFRGFEIVTRM